MCCFKAHGLSLSLELYIIEKSQMTGFCSYVLMFMCLRRNIESSVLSNSRKLIVQKHADK
jgi:hypothetical protein